MLCSKLHSLVKLCTWRLAAQTIGSGVPRSLAPVWQADRSPACSMNAILILLKW